MVAWKENANIFGAGVSSSVHIDNNEKNILVKDKRNDYMMENVL